MKHTENIKMKRGAHILSSLFCLLVFLCRLRTTLSQESATCGDFYYITQPPRSLPCNPYPPANSGLTSSLELECTISVPESLVSSSFIFWFRRLQGSNQRTQLTENGTQGTIGITNTMIVNVPSAQFPELGGTVVLRSVLEVNGLEPNSTDLAGMYHCRLGVLDQINGTTVVRLSNRSSLTELLDSSSYSTSLNRCEPGTVFLSLSPQCASFSGELPTTEPTSSTTTTLSSQTTDDSTRVRVGSNVPPDSPDSESMTFSLEMVIIIGGVGGFMALLVFVLLFILFITCCYSKRSKRKAPRNMKERSIPLSASMNNINLVENETSRTEPMAIATVDTPLFHPPAPSHPPPVHSTLPSRLKQNVIKMDSSEGSVDSSSMLIGRKGRAATVIGKLKTVCTPENENSGQIAIVIRDQEMTETLSSDSSDEQIYKSLIAGNMDIDQHYVVTNPLPRQCGNVSIHGSMESLDLYVDDQPVYSEPTIPYNLSTASLVQLSQDNYSIADDDDQPMYSEPTIPHSLSSNCLLKLSQQASSDDELPYLKARARFSLPLHQKLSVSTLMSEQDQPIYSEPDELETPNTSSSKLFSPTRQKKKPTVPPRPPVRNPNISSPLKTKASSHVASPFGVAGRKSIDGEYVYPNTVVSPTKAGGLKEALNQPREVVVLRNGDIAPLPHQYQGLTKGNREYLTLYMTPDN